MHPALATVIAAAGTALLAFGVVLRLGGRPVARDWVPQDEASLRNTLLMVPGFGAGLLGSGVLALEQDGRPGALSGLVVVVCIPLFVLLGIPGGLQLRVPLWFVPSWARDSVRRRRDAEGRGRRRARAARGRRTGP